MTPADLRDIRRRIAPDMSQREFAQALGWSPAAYYNLENGTSRPSGGWILAFQLLDRMGEIPKWDRTWTSLKPRRRLHALKPKSKSFKPS